jgi:hypothetical protein
MLQVTAMEGSPLSYAIGLGDMPLTADDEVTVRAIGKTFERTRAYTERIAHPIDVDFRDATDGNAGAMVRVNVPEMDAASLRVLGSTRTAGGRVKLVVGTKQADGAWLVAVPRLEPHVDVRLKVLFNLMNNKKIEAESDPISLDLPLAKPKHVGLDIDGHVIVDPVRPAPVITPTPVPEPPVEAPVVAESTQPSAVAPLPDATEPAAATVPEVRAPALWEWITMAGVAIASIALLAWLLRSRTSASAVAFDATLARYRATLASAATKPAGAATT